MKALLRFAAVSSAKPVKGAAMIVGRGFRLIHNAMTRGGYPYKFEWVHAKHLDIQDGNAPRYVDAFPGMPDFQTERFVRGDDALTKELWASATDALIDHNPWLSSKNLRILLVEKDLRPDRKKAIASFRLYKLAKPSTPSKR